MDLSEETTLELDQPSDKWFYGAILKEDPRDYLLGGSSIEIPKAFNQETFQYNQLEFSKKYGTNLCTLYAPIWMLSDLIGRNIPEREELCAIRVKMPDFDPSIGGELIEWDNCVRNWWNRNNPNNQIRQFKLSKDELFEALDKWHRVNIWYRGNKVYNEDAQSDGILDSIDIWKTNYGHSTTVKKRNDWKVVVDNYDGVKKFNIYSIKDFEAFIDSEITFPSYYLYLFANDAMDAEIALMKDKWKNERPDIIFNEAKIREYRERLVK